MSIINSIQLQNMQGVLEVEDEISFSCDNKSQSTKTDIKLDKDVQNKVNKQNLCIEVLKENINRQQSDKIRIKLQRELQNKNDQIYNINKKFKKIEQQLVKSTALATKLASQNELEKQKNKELVRQNQKYKNKLKQKQSKQLTQNQLAQLKQLQQQNSELNRKIAQIEKENKINVRRIVHQSEQTKKNLQSKLQVKNKQQLKVQELLQKKKQEFTQLIIEKDNQLAEYLSKIALKDKEIRHMSECLQESRTKITQLEANIIQLQQRSKVQYQTWKSSSQALKVQLRAEKSKSLQNQSKLLDALQSLQQHFEPDVIFTQPIQFINVITKSIITKLQHKVSQILQLKKHNQQIEQIQKQLEQKLKTHQQKIDKLNLVCKQAQTKSDRLQQKLKFMKQSEKNSVNFAEIIRQHLQQRQQHIKKEQSHNQKKDTDCKLNYKVTFNDSIPQKKHMTQQVNAVMVKSNIQQSLNKQKINTRSSFIIKNQPNEKLIQRSASTQLIDLKKAQYDSVVSQLTHKKQSLIFLMYQGQNNESIKPTVSKAVKPQQNKSIKRRSSSMSELVRQRCQMNTLNVHDGVYNI